jgi:ATP-binding cassette subfamily F protein uup
VILKGFSLSVQRGDRVAFVGPNGVGKTTLLRVLLGLEPPDAGTVRLGTNLAVAVFDQARAALDPDATLWDSLTADPEIGVSGRADQVMVRGMPRHVVGYLKDFLFDESQARAPVRSLSGGEKARLLLARLMAKESNVLVLDEPTNDLDIETLDLLQDVLGDYDGTVLLVSHDRDFIDRVATTTIWMSGEGRTTVYAGGWTDAIAQGAVVATEERGGDLRADAAPVVQAQAARAGKGLSFTEKHRLETLPGVIEKLEAEIGKVSALLEEADLFARDPVKFRMASEVLADRQSKLAAAEEEWLALAEKAESAG